MAVIAGELAKNIKNRSSQKCKFFTTQKEDRKEFISKKFFILIKIFFAQFVQNTGQRCAITKFE
jgi:hypothetical protein